MSESVVEHRTGPEENEQPIPSVGGESADIQTAERRQERDEDLLYGQPVIVLVRWIFIVSGLILALWNAETVGSLRLQLFVLFLLALENFYVHAQLLTGKPVDNRVVYASSAADLLFISTLIFFQGGYDSSLYVFYFPAIAALSVAFSTQLTAEYIAGVLAAYIPICLLSGGDALITVSRILMIVAVAFCGNRYWQIERSRRRAAVEAQEKLMAEIERQSTVAV
jgi:hypothetical protein